MNLSRLITGLVSLVFGLIIIFKYYSMETLIAGGILIVFGLIIIFNTKEDKIESIKK